jgi:hypothetical protein
MEIILFPQYLAPTSRDTRKGAAGQQGRIEMPFASAV